MSLQEIREVIIKLQPRIFEYDPWPRRDLNPEAPANYQVTSTRYVIINPVFKALS